MSPVGQVRPTGRLKSGSAHSSCCSPSRHVWQPQGRHRLGRRRSAGRVLSVLCQRHRADRLRGQYRARRCANPGGKLFAKWGTASKVWSVVVPTAIYAALIPYLGLYVSSALLIGIFMRWFGKYRWLTGDRRRDRGANRYILHVRSLVLGAAAQGPARTVLGY